MNKAPNPFLKEIVRQVGIHNIFSISGGPVIYRETGITLKVGRGYFVEIDLMPSDMEYLVFKITAFCHRGRKQT
mgnify:CR=1 FL=1